MIGVIDRINEKFAVVEFDDGSMQNILLDKIKGKAEEGDVIYYKCGLYHIDLNETNKRKKEADSFLDLWD
ncbi:DUF3006 domain-containing protein [Clostridium cylindrosporum]|uniref:DUF3006 domain-containing protein n=1 Tax=Clostridium cylindrosporum DSM 605 TaxID=1121307 RepID=A0A0J8DEX8_CLOCY|nr:DUF3006 domain-containing protein [Clostridium cylindrosporum]KMT22804.1 hypothetical protein CLCY_5c00430 [Clostridium cylindrosporum DSM 605]